MLEVWGMWSTPLLPSLPCPLWPGVVAPDRVIYIGQIQINCVGWDANVWHLNCVLMLNWIVWNRTVLTFSPYVVLSTPSSFIWKQSNGSKYFYITSFIQSRHRVKEFQVFLCITNNSVLHNSFICEPSWLGL